MKAKRTDPVLNRPNQGKDSREFLKNLDELMRRNKGSFGAMAFDVGSNKPYRVGSKQVPVREDVPSLQWSLPQVPEKPQSAQIQLPSLPELPEYPETETPQFNQLPDNPTPNQILDAIFQAAWEPELPSTEQLEQRYQQTGQVYAVQSLEDGSVRYNDGSVRAKSEAPPLPIASMADGSILWSDGFTRLRPPGGLSSYLAGVSGLSQFIFGQDQTVTQDFGNYNPGMGYASGRHSGTDFRTRDLQQRELYAPVQMRVVQIITEDSGSPYGNSVLLELPSGEQLRLSHLSSFGNLQPGSVLNPGELIGMPGSTGNSTGEHLDVEFYNQQGQLDNPNNFRTNVSQYSVANEIVGVSPYNQSPQQVDRVESPQTQSPPTPFTDAVKSVSQVPQMASEAVSKVTQPVKAAGQVLGTSIEQANPTGSFDLGISERLQGNTQGANEKLANTVERAGQQAGLPEMGISEAAREGGLTGALRQLAGDALDTISTPFKKIGLPDMGISETIAQGPTTNTGMNFLPANAMQGENYSRVPQRSDYANRLTNDLQNVGQELQAKAGQGIQALKGAGEGVKNLISTGLDKLTPRRVIGDQSGSVAQEVGETAQKVASQPKNDIRDPFFKQGGAQMYSKYLAPDAETKAGGALTMDLFSPDFFTDANNIANVFGSTQFGQAATDKYRASETSKYPMSSYSPIGYGEGAWSGDYRNQVDQYNRENQSKVSGYNKSITDYLSAIPSVLTSAFSFKDTPKPTSPRLSFGSITKSDAAPKMSYAITPQMSFNREAPQAPQMSVAPVAPQMSFARNVPQMSMAKPMIAPAPKAPEKPKPQPRPSLDDYLRMGKTVAQYFAETGQQSTLDSLQSQGYNPATNANPYNPYNDTGKQMSVGPQQGVSNAITAASQGYTYVSPSGNRIPNYTPANANMTDASTGLPVYRAPSAYPIASMADGRIRYSDGSIR